MFKGNYLFTSEAVTEGHPDKICDQISDAVLDEVLKNDKGGRVACETLITSGLVVVGGEITTSARINVEEIVKRVLKDIGYNNSEFGFDCENFSILNAIKKQALEIAKGVDNGGAGDQGIMFGYATDETEELMPAPILWANKLAKYLSYARKNGIAKHLGPDGKTQLTFRYVNGKPHKITTVLLSTQHTKDVLDKDGNITEEFKQEIINKIIKPCLGDFIDEDTEFLINPTGSFVIAGPAADVGVTGRKIMVDSYGGMAPHGGGAFSGKDPTKVDRSAAYMARYISKNIVASGIAEKCLIQLSYAIGLEKPLSLMVDTFSTSDISNKEIVEMIFNTFNLTPRGMIDKLELRNPIYFRTAVYGHFGRSEFSWEKTDMRAKIRDYFISRGYFGKEFS
jgi:S-adenosylmethionine synthetase